MITICDPVSCRASSRTMSDSLGVSCGTGAPVSLSTAKYASRAASRSSCASIFVAPSPCTPESSGCTATQQERPSVALSGYTVVANRGVYVVVVISCHRLRDERALCVKNPARPDPLRYDRSHEMSTREILSVDTPNSLLKFAARIHRLSTPDQHRRGRHR
jgi:hypothetical protein